MARYRFWFHNKDRKGRPLDEKVLQTAEEMAAMLAHYRMQEIGCESTANEMLQDAVEIASNTRRVRRIDNIPSYLTSVYRRSVNRFLNAHWRLVPVDADFIEDLAASEMVDSVEEVVHNRILLERLLATMDPATRQIFNWRALGYSFVEIAEELHVTPNAVSVRLTRGIRKATRRLRKARVNPGTHDP